MDRILHIGAHRTGSTAIQKALWAASRAEPAAPFAYWGPNRLRKIEGFPEVPKDCDTNGDPQTPEADRRHAQMRKHLRNRVDAMEA